VFTFKTLAPRHKNQHGKYRRAAMAHAKQASKRKRRRVALPILGAAGAYLAMGGASATVPTANLPSQNKAPLPEITLDEEEIFDVNLATFYVFDKENDATSQLAEKVAARGCGGCRGCAARGCGGCAARGCRGCAVVRGCRGCAVVRGCRGCGCGGCGCGGCGGCGSCWVWTPLGWVPVC
jgi:hypothetical protein